ncbi:MBL fold metallo-hydrolase [Arcicella sp. DC2W]|uniref:MBL fold metallo-hydrolase n=1 Tax=Arcicella gelida TaxID=2984195 RepID=A0ABU5S2R4_9BACT|nr:MBL fold metallo-hydrolase [Arcicella sp. DC2W]MEA5402778.1 MBL fold metallo-hydrolase [Arcicella sp. DC2W]
MKSSITVRMYNQNNLGDCFLLKIREDDYEKYMLIDFGSYTNGNTEKEKEIAEDIKNTVGEKPLTIVLTHQHKDHLSGFINANKIFERINVEEVWLSFLDDPLDSDATSMKKITEKFWKVNKENKDKLKEKFGNQEKFKKINTMLQAKDGIDGFGEELYAEKQSGGQAITNLRQWSNDNIRFLSPGEIVKLNNLNVYVLGPPKKIEYLKKLNPNKNEAVHHLNVMMELNHLEVAANLLNDALHHRRSDFPFSDQHSTKAKDVQKHSPSANQKQSYEKKDLEWRKIDFDWLNDFGRMSLHMDTLTNNSSLVLAFELPESKKVLLFVGDAQIGNWKSWFEVEFNDNKVKAKDLLSRTVFYKAGHHSSHNATLLEGLNLMNEKELVIMIPVNEDVSVKNGFAMLKPGMLAGYNRKSSGRVLRSDKIYQPQLDIHTESNFIDSDSDFSKNVIIKKDLLNQSHLYVEYTVY